MALTFFSRYLGNRQKSRRKFGKTFFFGERLIFRGKSASPRAKAFFFGEHLHLVSLILGLASSIPVVGLERFCPREVGPWHQTFFVLLASKIVSSTPPPSNTVLVTYVFFANKN